MLIPSRRPDESLCNVPDIPITGLGTKGNQMRLDIAAPKTVLIDREEVHYRKRREASAAAVSNSTPLGAL
jgi:carbon storage regulator